MVMHKGKRHKEVITVDVLTPFAKVWSNSVLQLNYTQVGNNSKGKRRGHSGFSNSSLTPYWVSD